jgi:hypothetical protein
MNICDHKKRYYFHENAPSFCPDCESYVDGIGIVSKGKKYILLERKRKIDKVLTNI